MNYEEIQQWHDWVTVRVKTLFDVVERRKPAFASVANLGGQPIGASGDRWWTAFAEDALSSNPYRYTLLESDPDAFVVREFNDGDRSAAPRDTDVLLCVYNPNKMPTTFKIDTLRGHHSWSYYSQTIPGRSWAWPLDSHPLPHHALSSLSDGA